MPHFFIHKKDISYLLIKKCIFFLRVIQINITFTHKIKANNTKVWVTISYNKYYKANKITNIAAITTFKLEPSLTLPDS